MPTPFSHLAAAQKFISDEDVPSAIRDHIKAEWSAFLFGSIAPDSQHMADLPREATHFFSYRDQQVGLQTPLDKMLSEHPSLQAKNISSPSHLIFVTGYLGHLAMDIIWWKEFFKLYFIESEWAEWHQRHLAFSGLIAIMDARDYKTVDPELYVSLNNCEPHNWLPFISDEAISKWRAVVANQLTPDGKSETIRILARSLQYQDADDLSAFINDEARLEKELWANVQRSKFDLCEREMYAHMKSIIIDYLSFN